MIGADTKRVYLESFCTKKHLFLHQIIFIFFEEKMQSLNRVRNFSFADPVREGERESSTDEGERNKSVHAFGSNSSVLITKKGQISGLMLYKKTKVYQDSEERKKSEAAPKASNKKNTDLIVQFLESNENLDKHIAMLKQDAHLINAISKDIASLEDLKKKLPENVFKNLFG